MQVRLILAWGGGGVHLYQTLSVIIVNSILFKYKYITIQTIYLHKTLQSIFNFLQRKQTQFACWRASM